MEQRFCQSYGMPLTADNKGTNADGSRNEDYCIYCYKDGLFTQDFTMEQMIDYCAQFVEHYNKKAGEQLTYEEYKNMLRQHYPNLKRWNSPIDQLPHPSPMKRQIIDEINALDIKDMPKVENLFILQGSFINIEYHLNGNSMFLLDNDATYWGIQIEKQNGEEHCFGIACDEKYILVSEYGKERENPEIVLLKRR